MWINFTLQTVITWQTMIKTQVLHMVVLNMKLDEIGAN